MGRVPLAKETDKVRLLSIYLLEPSRGWNDTTWKDRMVVGMHCNLPVLHELNKCYRRSLRVSWRSSSSNILSTEDCLSAYSFLCCLWMMVKEQLLALPRNNPILIKDVRGPNLHPRSWCSNGPPQLTQECTGTFQICAQLCSRYCGEKQDSENGVPPWCCIKN